MLVAWHPTRCWDLYVTEDEKKGLEPFLDIVHDHS